MTVPGEELLWQLEHCIHNGTVPPVVPGWGKKQLVELRRAGMGAVVCNEGYIARALASGGRERLELIKAVFKNTLGEPIPLADGRTVYVLK